ncbi:MAG: alpha/beta hydrolase [Gemmatimonadota bacterium]
MIAHLQRMLGKKKVVVLGFSWGSLVGIHLAAKRPDLMHAYVGVGQVGIGDDERYLFDRAVELATSHKNDSALAELRAIAPYPGPDKSHPEASARLVRKWAGIYNGGWYGWPNLDLFYRVLRLASEYSEADFNVQRQGSRYAGDALYEAMMRGDPRKLVAFRVPMIFFAGPLRSVHAVYDRAAVL